MDSLYTIQQIDKAAVVHIHAVALMEPADIQTISDGVNDLIDHKNQRKLIVDFDKVEYLSSRAINILLSLKKKLSDVPGGQLVICGVGTRLSELIRITRLDKILDIKASQQEAVQSIAN